MLSSLGIGFASPWLLFALAGLPLLWILLRAVPPAPIRRLFPGVVLLLGLDDDDNQTDKTPWWLLFLRSLAVAFAIVGFSGPVLNPDQAKVSTGPLLILMDGGWADAVDWDARSERVKAAIDEAGKSGRPVAVVQLTGELPPRVEFLSADIWDSKLAGLVPNPWEPDADKSLNWANELEGTFESFWISDGLERPGRSDLLTALSARGQVTIFESSAPVYGLRPPIFEDGTMRVEVARAGISIETTKEVEILGLDPSGIERVFERVKVEFETGDSVGSGKLLIQPELRNRISRFRIVGPSTAGSVVLSDDSSKRRKVALFEGIADQEGLQLLSATHYLEQALSPSVDLIDGSLSDIIVASPDVIVLADLANLAPADAKNMEAWVNKGGLLLRFAGPRLAASDVSRGIEDPLMPVRLRSGGRTIGGTMSWGQPKNLREFAPGSLFQGLDIPDDVEVSAQVIAEPDPNLSSRVIAALSDGTPLVTRKDVGSGQVVLFHVTANAEWSTLPLSGLFVEMLQRLYVTGNSAGPDIAELAGTTWIADQVLDGFGVLQDGSNLAGVPGELIAAGIAGAKVPPGLYIGADRTIALNLIRQDRILEPAIWPSDTVINGFDSVEESKFGALLLIFSLAILAVDVFASLWVGGRLRGPVVGTSVALLAIVLLYPDQSMAQSDGAAIEATSNVVLAHVLTGNREVDRIAQAGLRGLSDILFQRTSVEPSEPVSVDIENDELAFFPFLYWPIAADQKPLSEAAIVRVNRYLQTGGLILFDTKDADVAGYGLSSPNGRKLQIIAGGLDIPALEPLPQDHVLTRTFYLLDNFPGRYIGRSVWVEASSADAELAEGMPFRNLNDNVTPVVIGGNDWASAWAVDEIGNWMFPIGRGTSGDRQREIANRFGVNLIMYVLTGNYKSDQVHVPALLDRLGQ